ncbi:nuclear transport factor 2 family protein [Paraglaciecola sp.]|uniref:nuclear transport factor 2 family protein n=1 Tax=Paraglaciecola sp. TaxID=1920173 RepID=UPI003EF53B21
MQNDQINKVANTDSPWLSNFMEVYQALTTTNLHDLQSIYHPDIVFIDPIHKIEGFENLHKYFSNLYQNLSLCEFKIQKVIEQADEAAIYWNMTYQHNKLNKGKKVVVEGSSFIKGHEGKVIYHRDYLDLGAMLYEQIPFFGTLTKWIKAKAQN